MLPMESAPKPRSLTLRELIAGPLAIAAMAASLGGPAVEDSAAQSRTPKALSADMLEKHNIHPDLPDIINADEDGFEGSKTETPGAVWPSGPSDATYRQGKDECKALIISRPTGDWTGCLVVPKNRRGPISCGFVVSQTVSSSKIYDEPENPCYDELIKMKSMNINDWDNNCKGKPYKCVDGTPVDAINSTRCDYTVYRQYASDRRDYTNMSYPETRGGHYYAQEKFEPGDTLHWRTISDDKKSLRVRTSEGRWGSADRDCFPKKLPRGAEPDKRKTADTVAGPNPNQTADYSPVPVDGVNFSYQLVR